MNKGFKTYDEQVSYLNDDKRILTKDEDKIFLVRHGYFNLVNGYKEPFVAGKKPNGDHVYLADTTIGHLLSVKEFDEDLRYHLMKHITRVEQEIRQTFAYKFDHVNGFVGSEWENCSSYDEALTDDWVKENLNNIKKDLDSSTQSYVIFYKNNHPCIPTWIMLKYIGFSKMIDFIKISKPDVKKSFCDLYNIETDSSKKGLFSKTQLQGTICEFALDEKS